MKSWPLVVSVLCVLFLAAVVRRSLRHRVTEIFVARAGLTERSGRAAGLLVFGGLTVAALAVVALGFWARCASDPVNGLRYVAAALVLGLYVPLATLGTPRMTRWQKSFADRLVLAGLPREAAVGVGSVAGPVSGIAVIVGLVGAALVV